MEKVLVEIYVPAIRKTFDTLLPPENRMEDVVTLVSKIVTTLSNELYKAGEETVLCDAQSGCIFDKNLTVYELKIQNGAKLILI